jgi:hypothetical protein
MLQMIRLVKANNADNFVPFRLPDSQLLAQDESEADAT